MALASSSSSSSSATPQAKYDVFLSFRGEDTRDSFTSHVYAALRRKQVKTFIDFDGLKRGDEISPVLLKAIERSKISVIIFSEDYASSRWCLEELEKIIECKEKNRQMVVPVFYHVNALDVQNQTGSYEEAFVKHEKRFMEVTKRVQKWRVALTEAAKLPGWDSAVIRPDSKLVDEIVGDILKKLNHTSPSSDYVGLVGLDSRVEQIKSLLAIGLSDFRVVGIWGMGGIGKTTIAGTVFNQICSEFEGCCFIANVREESENFGGLVRLREQAISTILEEEKLHIGGSNSIPLFVKYRLQRTKVLIVLDDVNDLNSLKFLTGGLERFGAGSRVIITTRDKQLLCNYGVNYVYEVERFKNHEALQIFCTYAFKQNYPLDEYMVLSNSIINYADGNPLVLKVLGSSLYRQSKQAFRSALYKLKRIPNPKIHYLLKVSYDGLDYEEKNMFLDIACFFKGKDIDYVTNILASCYVASQFGLGVLCDKSLITISRSTILMHDLLQEMGWEIVYQESLKDPGKRSRLWNHEDVFHVLKKNTGTHKIEGISLDMSQIRDVHLRPGAFANMINLRFLKFYVSHQLYNDSINVSKVHLSRGLNYLSEELRYLHWDGYPAKRLPSNFDPVNLMELKLPYSNIEQLWEGSTQAFQLKVIDLHHSDRLIGIPDLSNAPLLETIKLEYCKTLLDVSSSIKFLDNLRILSLIGCESLRSFPSNIHFQSLGQLDLTECINLKKFPLISGSVEIIILQGTAIEEVPSSIQHVNNLRELNLSSCKNLRSFEGNIHFKSHISLSLADCVNLRKFPQISGNVTTLYLSGSGIEEVPSSIDCLPELSVLHMEFCSRLRSISSSICKLKSLSNLHLSDCSKLQTFPEIFEKMECLEYLSISRATTIKELPSSIEHLNGVCRLTLKDCESLETIPSSLCKLTSLIALDVSGCSKLKRLPESLTCLDSLNLSGTAVSQLPSSISSWTKLEYLDCSGCRGLVLPALSSLCSLILLDLSFCSLTKIPEDICCLPSLETLDLSRNNFENLPARLKQISRLSTLHLSDCNMLKSIPELPLRLNFLEANNCKMLQSLPKAISSLEELDASDMEQLCEFLSKLSGMTVEFIFTNCPRFNRNAYDNILANMASMLLFYEKVYKQIPPVSFCLPGSEIPRGFNYQSSESSISIEFPRQRSNKSFIGISLCAVIAFEEDFCGDDIQVNCFYEFQNDDYVEKRFFYWHFCGRGMKKMSIESDHIAVALEPSALPIKGDYTATFEFSISDYFLSRPINGCKLKCCGVCPIYAQPNIMHPIISIENFAVTIEDSGVTRKLRRDYSNNDQIEPDTSRIGYVKYVEEELEPHLKKIRR